VSVLYLCGDEGFEKAAREARQDLSCRSAVTGSRVLSG